MKHLNFIGIENFKVFKDLNRFELKPITILVGTNSSGKSSLTKGMLTIKSSFEKVSGEDYRKFYPLLGIIPRDNLKIYFDKTEKLSFHSVSNLGNFSNCVNNESDNPYISFELPIKFLPLQDTFLIRFTYKKSENAIQDGTQANIKIIHLETNTDILNFDCDKGQANIKFSFLKERLDLEVKKLHEIQAISNEIEELMVLHQGENLSKKYPKEIELQINDLKKKQRKLYPDFKLIIKYISYPFEEGGYLDIDHNLMNEFSIIRNYYSDSTLINFPFVHLEFLKSSFDIWDENKFDEDEFYNNKFSEVKLNLESFLFKNEMIINELLSKTDNLIEYLKKLEIDSLDELLISEVEYKGKGFSSILDQLDLHIFSNMNYSGKGFLTYTKNRENKIDNIMAQTIGKMIEKEPLLDDTAYELWTQNIFNVVKIKKINGETLIDNFSFFMHDFILKGLYQSMDDVCKFYENIHFIPAVRTKMDRFFRIGERESYLQELLYEFHQTKLSDVGKQFIDTYIQKFGIADSIELKITDDSVGTKIYLSKDGKRLELADVGYGVAQILPIILKLGLLISGEEGYRRKYISVIIEEPETNLHPALQSKLADMFVEYYQKYNIPLIIETHSEYFIRKLQYLTAKKEFAAKDSVIFYFNDLNNIPAGEKQVKKIEILEDGSLSDDFGSGFFDEADNLAINLFNLQNRKN